MKILVGVIQSEANQDVQDEWIRNLKELEGEHDVLIVENSFNDGNFEFLKDQFKHILKGPYFNTIRERIIENRNIVLNWFREHKEYDKLLLLDSDIFPPKEALNELISTNKKIASSVCWIAGKANSNRVAWNFFEKDVESGFCEGLMDGIEENKNYIREDGKIVEIMQTGLGCVLFDGKMLRESDVEFRDDDIVFCEDFTFINDLNKLGYKTFLNMKVNCFHSMNKFRGGGIDG